VTLPFLFSSLFTTTPSSSSSSAVRQGAPPPPVRAGSATEAASGHVTELRRGLHRQAVRTSSVAGDTSGRARAGDGFGCGGGRNRQTKEQPEPVDGDVEPCVGGSPLPPISHFLSFSRAVDGGDGELLSFLRLPLCRLLRPRSTPPRALRRRPAVRASSSARGALPQARAGVSSAARGRRRRSEWLVSTAARGRRRQTLGELCGDDGGRKEGERNHGSGLS
jgi:hypothetical protein